MVGKFTLTNHTCLYSPAAGHHRPLTGTHYAYSPRDGQAELTWVTGYILRRSFLGGFTPCPSTVLPTSEPRVRYVALGGRRYVTQSGIWRTPSNLIRAIRSADGHATCATVVYIIGVASGVRSPAVATSAESGSSNVGPLSCRDFV